MRRRPGRPRGAFSRLQQARCRDQIAELGPVENLGFGVGMILVAAALDSYGPLTVVAWSHGAAIVVAVVFLIRVSGTRGRTGVPAPRSGADRGGPVR